MYDVTTIGAGDFTGADFSIFGPMAGAFGIVSSPDLRVT